MGLYALYASRSRVTAGVRILDTLYGDPVLSYEFLDAMLPKKKQDLRAPAMAPVERCSRHILTVPDVRELSLRSGHDDPGICSNSVHR